MGPFGLTYSRTRAVEFSSPILIDYYRILIKRAKAEPDPWGFLAPFSLSVWMGIIACVFIIGILFKITYNLVGEFYPMDRDLEESTMNVRAAIPHTWSGYFFASMGALTNERRSCVSKSI